MENPVPLNSFIETLNCYCTLHDWLDKHDWWLIRCSFWEEVALLGCLEFDDECQRKKRNQCQQTDDNHQPSVSDALPDGLSNEDQNSRNSPLTELGDSHDGSRRFRLYELTQSIEDLFKLNSSWSSRVDSWWHQGLQSRQRIPTRS